MRFAINLNTVLFSIQSLAVIFFTFWF